VKKAIEKGKKDAVARNVKKDGAKMGKNPEKQRPL